MMAFLCVISHMQRFIYLFMALAMLTACNQNKQQPNVSSISVRVEEQYYEQDFFKIDTNHLDESLQQLDQRYKGFNSDFLYNILGTTPETVQKDLPAFLNSYQSIFLDARVIFKQSKPWVEEIKKGFQHVKYYFPAYQLPKKIITFIGPINSFGTIITPDAIAIGLQLFLGKNHPLYASEQSQAFYPAYLSRRFEPAYIPVAAMRNIVEDIYPVSALGMPLIEQMVESGKRLFLLEHFLPTMPDSSLTGYTQEQLRTCMDNEKNIWSFFIQNDLLYKTDPQFTRDYMNDAPYTQAFGNKSPGNIGQFVGWQIVKKWADKNPTISLKTLLEKNPGKLFSEAKYKPTF